MDWPLKRKCGLLLLFVLGNIALWAHPTGNMITVGKYVLWAYVDPVDDPAHHACLMLWHPNGEPEVLIRSDHPASDFMLYNRDETIYAIERRHLRQAETFEIRILKFKIGESPKVIWDWFEDQWRIGEGGFLMPTDDEVIFGRYPSIYSLKRQGTPTKYFQFESPINRVRAVEEGDRLLLLGPDQCWLVDYDGNIIKHWVDLLYENVDEPPLGRNQIFDADYQNGLLLLAYWGNRSYFTIDNSGVRKELVKQSDPLVPHWVAHYGERKLLFSSKLVFNGSNPRPVLLCYEKTDLKKIWLID